ncbi:hypothetical protein TrCOL_g13001 [Triparma columacea]|uniref:Uncharacterized protein n=1 Tax=Triparma columacea TaxID=722753 RepID=A0A9W7L8R4_9STRA|nr:hypothetical protein TrCOL_g13001 [Triparma columacea]
MVGFKDTPTVVSSPGGNVEEVGGGVEKSESRKYRKTGVGVMGLNDYEGDILSDDDSLTAPTSSSIPNGDHARFANSGGGGEVEDKDHRVYRKTGAGVKFGSFNIDDIDDDDSSDDGKDVDDDDVKHVGFEVNKPGRRRESSVTLKTTGDEGESKRTYRKTGAGQALKFGAFNMDDIDDDDEEEEEEDGQKAAGGKNQNKNETRFADADSTPSPSPSVLKSGLKSGLKQKKTSTTVNGGTKDQKGGGIRFGGEDTTVDFDVEQSVSELPKKRQFRKTGAPKFSVNLDEFDDDDEEDSLGNFLDSDDKNAAKPNTSVGFSAPIKADTAKIQKSYRKTGVSFGSYSMDDEVSDDDAPPSSSGDEVPPSDSLLNASPAYLKFRTETKESYDNVIKRLERMEAGLLNSGNATQRAGPVELDLDLSFQYGFTSGGAGLPLDLWGTLLILSHSAMIVFTLLYLLDAGVGQRLWMGVFLAFLIITMAKWCTTMNRVKVQDARKKTGGGNKKEKEVIIQAEKAGA